MGPARKSHMDAYTIEGVASTFTLGITINLNDGVPRVGGFIFWLGTHLMAAEYFKTHSILNGMEAYMKRCRNWWKSSVRWDNLFLGIII